MAKTYMYVSSHSCRAACGAADLACKLCVGVVLDTVCAICAAFARDSLADGARTRSLGKHIHLAWLLA